MNTVYYKICILRSIAVLFLCLILGVVIHAQASVKSVLLDSENKGPIAFAYILNLTTDEGVLSNEDGYFVMPITSSKDSIQIRFLGYKTITSIGAKIEDKTIMVKETYALEEVTVAARDDYSYQVFKKCKKKLSKKNTIVSKGYLSLQTHSNEQPTEMLQAFYNVNHYGPTIDDLGLKIGRIALAPVINNYFVTLGTTKSMCNIDLLTPNDQFPFNPFQVSRIKLKYDLRVKGRFDHVVQIQATPLKNSTDYFTCEIWIDERDFSLLKVHLMVQAAIRLPFRPIYLNDDLRNVNFSIVIDFAEATNFVKSIRTDYDYDYIDTRGGKKEAKRIKSEALLYNYDYSDPFLLPFYEYTSNHDDYRKISFFPFDSAYWQALTVIENSLNQDRSLDYFDQNGFVINFNKNQFTSLNDKSTFFEDNNIVWSRDSRISIKAKNLDISKISIMPKSDIKVQIMLDVREIDGKVEFVSQSILDVFESKYYLTNDPIHLTYLNLYFDLCELHRLSLMNGLVGLADSSLISDQYALRKSEMEKQLKQFTKETDYGQNLDNMKRWNQYVDTTLGINNMAYFKIDF